MARSVLEIDVKDEQFKAFQASFEKYNAELAQQPGVWKMVGKEGKSVEAGFKAMTSALLAQADMSRRVASNENEIAKAAKVSSVAWGSIRKDAAAVAHSVRSISIGIRSSTTDFLKWSGIVGGITALAGIGGSLWGLDRLAATAGSGRRASSGLGLSYGQHAAFEMTYNRAFNAGGFLGGVSEGRGNPSSGAAQALYALGIDPSKGSASQTSSAALDKIRALLKDTPDDLIGILPQSHRLGDLGLGTEDLRRIKGMSNQEYDQYKSENTRRQGLFGLDDPTAKAWQDFGNKVEESWKKVETSFIKGLVGLTPELNKLSDAFSGFVTDFIGSETFKGVISTISTGLKEFAKYIGDGQFKKDLKSFVDDFTAVTKAIGSGLRLLGILPSEETGTGGPGGGAARPPPVSREEWDRQTEAALKGSPQGEVAEKRYRERRANDYNQYIQRYGLQGSDIGSITGGALGGGGVAGAMNMGASFLGGIVGQKAINNPGGMRGPGGVGFLEFPSKDAGLIAASKNLQYYKNREGRDTIESIIRRWAPNNENDTEAYIKRVSDATKFKRDQKIDMNDLEQRSAVLSAITSVESMHYYSAGAVKVVIENNTGGSAATSVNSGGIAR